MKKQLLFVDDSENVLQGIRTALWRRKRDWEMHFASSVGKAIDTLYSEDIDVVVTDLMMPERDGVELLNELRETFPSAVRLVLTGVAGSALAEQAIPLAHQLLTKPCPTRALEGHLSRALELGELLETRDVRKLIGQRKLPAQPLVYHDLRRAMEEQEGFADVVAIIERDPGISAKVLHLVNSSWFAVRRRIRSLEDAVLLLGLRRVSDLVLSCEVFDIFPHTGLRDFPIDELQRHGLLTASIASELADERMVEAAFAAGLLHDIGKLLLATYFSQEYAFVRRKAASTGQRLVDAELEGLGVSHEQVGAYLLGMWGFPQPIVSAVENHHDIRDARSVDDLGGVLHVADELARLLEAGDHAEALEIAKELGHESSMRAWSDLMSTTTAHLGIATA